jgi:hypothetical protein
MTKDEALARVREELDLKLLRWGRLPEDFVIVDELTRQFPWGWVFFYNSRRFIETRDPLEAVGGNAPFIVNRSTGEVLVTGTAQSIEHYIQEYEASLT